MKQVSLKLASVVLRSGAGFPGGVAPKFLSKSFATKASATGATIFRARLIAKEFAPTLRTTLFVEASILAAHPSFHLTLLWHKLDFRKNRRLKLSFSALRRLAIAQAA
ncbi:hypothetical protein [Solibacillus sp. FSL K6-4121]|uniref:hypothetical protein n=1 Tax=Solibacillus sp. FSL K6-4121 TaxID=2921505 RepID=UPI0030FBE675